MFRSYFLAILLGNILINTYRQWNNHLILIIYHTSMWFPNFGQCVLESYVSNWPFWFFQGFISLWFDTLSYNVFLKLFKLPWVLNIFVQAMVTIILCQKQTEQSPRFLKIGNRGNKQILIIRSYFLHKISRPFYSRLNNWRPKKNCYVPLCSQTL